MKILWGITGAGHLLKDSLEILSKVSQEHEITLIFSNAGLEVVKLYGYMNKINQIISRNEKNTIIYDDDQKYSYPLSGKLTHDKYDLIIISPTTANTTAKIVHGIADTLITNVVAQSGKGQIPLIIVPVDQKEGLITTTIPPYIDKKLCRICNYCKPSEICPQNAINAPIIETINCISCMKCKNQCPYDAIITDKKIELYIRKIDAQNTEKLEEIENITTLFNPKDILKIIDRKK